ncbi:disulfide bond formation protein B [Pseudomonas viridiflava]|uniref:Disulfide bond formation protein B n=1 Tax=Pseudomonas viridiflava TaxID=33069 RepID=A0A3M5NYQ3_PSEVI|nr:disulfide bond formation protein B [Pseudomonas viridiflava]MBA1231272.1 disulfide bond formation protein B [Pseudomonas viridiflava]RMT77508.1 Disulfide bond formation protein B [Pseudomonas viridiflava]
MHLARTRSLFFLACLTCALIIAAVLYLQRVVGLEPCALCLTQRAAMVSYGVLTLAAACHSPAAAGWCRYCGALLLIALAGAVMAGTQVWLQTASADQLIPLVASLERLFASVSLGSWNEGLRGQAAFCAQVTWSLFGLSLPEWSLLAFVGLALLPLYPLLSELSLWIAAGSRADD